MHNSKASMPSALTSEPKASLQRLSSGKATPER